MLLRLLLLAFFSVSSVNAQNLPELGDASEATLSAERERALGETIMRDIRKEVTLLEDTEINDYLNKLGATLMTSGRDRGQRVEFFVIKDSSLNAFALPGGFIGVHTGLILAAQSESELVAVLAHEIAHITQRHLARMISRSKEALIPSLAALAVAILAARSNPQLASAALATAQATSIQSQLDFSREHEREADRVGLNLMDAAGYDPRAMPTFFERFQRAGRVYDSAAPSYLRTHPITTERVADVLNRVENLRYRQVLDSADFQLIKAKTRALEGTPSAAIDFFSVGLQDKKYSSEAAYRYGLAWAYLLGKKADLAEQQLGEVRQRYAAHPLLYTLAGEIKLRRGDLTAAKMEFQKGLKLFPQHRALAYGYAQALIDSNNPREALVVINEALTRGVPDAKLYELQANAHTRVGVPLLAHQALAEAYAVRGNFPAAIEQLELAKKNSRGSFYQLSSVEARLRELRRLEEEAKRAKKPE